jgi:hypothetical protein
MKRRAFISLLGGTAAWPLAARAQQGDRVRRIGVLMASAADDSENQARMAAFLQGLAQLGWTDGRNVRIDTRWATTNADGAILGARIPTPAMIRTKRAPPPRAVAPDAAARRCRRQTGRSPFCLAAAVSPSVLVGLEELGPHLLDLERAHGRAIGPRLEVDALVDQHRHDDAAQQADTLPVCSLEAR